MSYANKLFNNFIKLLKVPYFLIQVVDAKKVALQNFLLPANKKVNSSCFFICLCHLLSDCPPPGARRLPLPRGSNHSGQEKPGQVPGH